MEIELKHVQNARKVGSLSVGNCFCFKKDYWILTDADEDIPSVITCIGLSKNNAGESVTIGPDVEVIPVNFKLVEI